MHTGLKTAAEDAILMVTLKALLMVVGGLGFFLYVTATVRLHLFFLFSSFPPLPKNSCENQFC